MVEIKPITAEQTHMLRRTVLRQPVERLHYPGDDEPGTYHLGAFVEGKLVGTASIFREAPAGTHQEDAWRLRGMATLPEVRGLYYGASLLEAMLKYAHAQGAALIWCNAGINVAGFFEHYGFEVVGNPHALGGALSYYLEYRGEVFAGSAEG